MVERVAKAHVVESLESLSRSCREAGLKVTPQRLAVYEAVLRSTAHPSPEAVFQAVREKMPTISLATVYKTLDFLEEQKWVERISSSGETRRYDANREPHHHLVCRSCDSITDYPHDAFRELHPQGPLDGFVPDRLVVQVYGICACCASTSS